MNKAVLGIIVQDRQHLQTKYQTRSRNHCCRGKAKFITYSECVYVALVIQQAKRMRHVILSFVACMATQYFYTLSHKRHDFWKKVFQNRMCVFTFLYRFQTFLILRRIQRDTIQMYRDLHVKYPSFSSDFNKQAYWIFMADFIKIIKNKIS